MLFRSLLMFALLICGSAHAKRFRNAYVSFELPPNWNCKLEGSEWVCESDFSRKTKEAIIILTAKEVGPTDTLPAYLAHLQTPRMLSGRAGAPTKSQIIHVKERMIGNHMWIDGMHLGSEVGPYFTRYLATIKDRIAILVTFSAHKQHYTKYSGDFIKAVESLRVVATKDTLGGRAGLDPRRGSETIGAPIGQNIAMYDPQGLPAEGAGREGFDFFTWFLVAVLCGAIGGYFYLRSRGKGKKK
ncbi:MAG: hypothetical protein AB7G93_20715 [Bdellovibrionales bacterium]